MIYAQISETAKLHELASQQGFGTYMLAFFCSVLMYVIITLWKKNESLNDKLLNSYMERNRINEHLSVISQHLNSKNYDLMEQHIKAMQRKEEML